MDLRPEQQRLIVFTNSPAPYRDQLFRSLAQRFASVHVYYDLPVELDRDWETVEAVPSTRLRRLASLGPLGTLHRGVIGAVRSGDVIAVGGYERITYVLALLAGRMLRRRVIFFFDGIAPSRVRTPGALLRLKRIILRLPHVCLANGSIGRRYLVDRLRVPPDRVANQYLVPVEIGSRFGTADRSPTPSFDILFIGRLVPRKGLHLLLEAARHLPGLRLGIGGSGPLRDELERDAVGLDVTFLEELTQHQVADVMAASRCLVVPSHDEPWGLVVQEALQCDLPVVVMPDVGCVEDLVIPGHNGVIPNASDAAALADAIKTCLDLPPSEVQRANDAILERWNLHNHAQAFVLAAR